MTPRPNQDATLDKDWDGLSNLEEYQNGSNPTLADSDGDGVTDCTEELQLTQPRLNSVGIKLRTLDTGKVNNGQNCAACYTTKFKVGDHSVVSVKHGQSAERTERL